MRKGTYKATDIKNVDLAELLKRMPMRVVIGVDVAKVDQFAALTGEDREVIRIVKWTHPAQTLAFYDLCGSLAKDGRVVELVMEPSGTYGDAIRAGLLARNFVVYRVSGKRVHDEAEIQDGVGSMHDAKAAVVIARLHIEKKGTRPWPLNTDVERELESMRQVMALHRDHEYRLLNQLEGLTARHWPEVTSHLGLTSVTLLELLAAYGGPAAVDGALAEARTLMVKVGRQFLRSEVVDALLATAKTTTGMPMLGEEVAHVQAVATAALHSHRLAAAAEKRLVARADQHVRPELSALLGKATAASLVASGLNPEKYSSPGAYEKSFGLNLKERSSGRKKGQLTITKRGDSRSRRLLYLAVLRLTQSDSLVKAWYAAKIKRDGGKKMKAVVAVMRKLVRALWHVGRGHVFDSSKLFDESRLTARNAPEKKKAS